MKVDIRDPVILDSVLPASAAAYLDSSGWTQAHESGAAAVWTHPAEPDVHEVLLPLDPSASGYAQRVRELLSELEAIEGRSQLQIFQDLRSSDCDVIRFGPAGGVAAEHPTLGSSLSIRESGRDILSAVAHAVIEPQPWFLKRRPKEVSDYLASLELGFFDEPGWVCVMSRLDASLYAGVEDEFVPFPRNVSLRLRDALDQLARLLADKPPDDPATDWLSSSLAHGLSGNVCESISDLIRHEHSGISGVEVTLRLSSVRKFSGPAFSRWTFRRSLLHKLREVSERLKTFALRSDDSVLFLITEIRPTRRGATVRGIGLVDGEARTVSMSVDDELLKQADLAKSRNEAVRCQGRLRRKAATNGYEVLQPHEFEILRAEDPGVKTLRKKTVEAAQPTQYSLLRERS